MSKWNLLYIEGGWLRGCVGGDGCVGGVGVSGGWVCRGGVVESKVGTWEAAGHECMGL